MENNDYRNCVERALFAAKEAELRGFVETAAAFGELARSLRCAIEVEGRQEEPAA